jgi:hypothetical protein
VHCIDRCVRGALWAGVAGLGVLAGCSSSSSVAPTTPAPVAGSATSDGARTAGAGNAPASPSAPTGARAIALSPPGPVRNWNEVRLQAAQRLVAANPGRTYMGEVPEPLLAIPVLEIELHGDGSIRRIVVLRKPGQALDTVKLATDAVHRAAPFGDVSRLPKPWRFTETFLFNDDRKFKPRTLDQ